MKKHSILYLLDTYIIYLATLFLGFVLGWIFTDSFPTHEPSTSSQVFGMSNDAIVKSNGNDIIITVKDVKYIAKRELVDEKN